MKQEQYQDVIQMYEDGIPPTQIAREMELGRATVNRWIRQHRISLEYAHPNLEEEEEDILLSGIRKFDLDLREEDLAIRKKELSSKIATWKNELLKGYKSLCKDLIDKIESNDPFDKSEIRAFKHQISDLIAKFDLIYNHDADAFEFYVLELKPRDFLQTILLPELSIIPEDGLMLENNPLKNLLEEGLMLSDMNQVDRSLEWTYQEEVVIEIRDDVKHVLSNINNQVLDRKEIKKLNQFFQERLNRIESLSQVFNVWEEEAEQEMLEDKYQETKSYLKELVYFAGNDLLKSFNLINSIAGKMVRVPEHLLEESLEDQSEQLLEVQTHDDEIN